MNINLNNYEKFENRHNSVQGEDFQQMLATVGVSSIEELISQTIPASIRLNKELDLPKAVTEYQFLNEFKEMASKNKIAKSYIGMGYYECITPTVILRNILENPGWYTAYTPYQAEIAQGRLEMLLNFQTVVSDLTGMDLANASLLDEGTAAAEAMSMFYGLRKKDKKTALRFFADENCNPQTINLLQTRAEPLGIDLQIASLSELDVTDTNLFGIMLSYPNTNGHVEDYTNLIAAAKENNVKVGVVADLLALTLLKSPGSMGADAVVGSAQRFGVPMGYGGPHAAFFATREDFKRQIPGRIIGVSKDVTGKEAYRMALQTREQHIKREKATSNICTAQVLLAVMAGAYAIYHGPKGLKEIAARTHGLASLASDILKELGYEVVSQSYFDTLKVAVTAEQKEKIQSLSTAQGINFRYFESNHIGIAFNQTNSVDHVAEIAAIWAEAAGKATPSITADSISAQIPSELSRTERFMEQPVFNTYHSEHEMLRYLKKLENKDLSLVHSMISLGSCTMKLNATTEMIPVTWPEWGSIHPFTPKNQAQGYYEMFEHLEKWLCEITGFDAMSLQPNSGAQGEYTGLMTIRAYHLNKGDTHRKVAIIPASAHGTNPASAVMAGMKVVIVKTDERGNIDLDDLKTKVEANSENLAALMVTYPSTHGVFEEDIKEICDLIHQHGGRVYMDGANMNAQVGLTSPALIGADVCHLNLHKTFCIPHGGGGPGMGPIGVVKDLAPFLPGHTQVKTGGEHAINSISAAPYGSASILTISYAYIAMMGGDGLRRATERAILNANYVKERLKDAYPILYVGKNGRAAHEMIIDCRAFKKTANIEVEDIAKRLMDYGFHAPTVSFPVAGTMMIEPTESESKVEIDRFCNAMIAIREEIKEIEAGTADPANNVLKNAPHTAEVITGDAWNLPYTRQKAAYPLTFVKEQKFWPAVQRIDNAYGDRNLICSCIPVEQYATEAAEV